MTERNRNPPYLQKAMQAADIGFWEWDLVTDKVAYSPEWKRQLGYAEDEISDDLEEWKSRLHPDDLPRVMQHDADFKSRRVPTYKVEFRLRHKDGSWRWIHSSAEVVRSKDGKPLRMVGCHIDVTQRKAIEAENARNFRALQVVSESNAALVRATDKGAYLKEVCRIAVELGGYRMVWVGKAEEDERKTVRPVAQAGFEAEYLQSAAITWADCERGRGPVGTAIRTGRPSVIRDTSRNLTFRPWLEEARKRGYQSCIALPLVCDGTIWGALAAYSSEVDAFNDGEFKILQELAQDLGFGIAVMRTRAEHDRATEALRESERRLAEAQRVAHVGHWERDLDTGQLALSEEIYRIFGCDPQQGIMSEADLHALLHPEDRATQAAAMAEALRGGPRYNVEYRVIRPNGELRFVHCQGDVKRDESGRPRRMFGTIQDITERKQTEESLRQSERKLAAAQRVAHLGHWEYEFDSDRLLWSEETYRIFGQSPLRGVLTKAEFKEFIHPDDISPLLEKVDQAAQGGPPYDFDYRVIRPIGEMRFVHSQGEVKWDQSGRAQCIFGVVQDVTDHRLADEALRASERRLAEAQRIAHVGDWDYNLQTEAMSWSDEAYRIFGLPPQQPGISTLKEYQEFIHPEDRQGRAEAVCRSINNLTDYDHEHRLIRPNGEVRFIHCRGEVTQDALGRPAHFVGTVQDVTERRQSEEALRESERKLAEAQQIAHVGHWERDLDTDRFFLSDEAQRICGRDPQETAWSLTEFLAALHPYDRARKVEAMTAALHGGPYNVEYRVIRPNGELRFVHCQGEVKREEAGRPRRMFGTIQDITDRKLAEEAVRESELRFRDLVNAIEGIVWEAEALTFRFSFVSQQAERVLGYPVENWLQKPGFWADHVHPDDRERSMKFCIAATREKRDHVFEYRMIAANGQIVWLRDMVRVVVEDGGSTRLRGVMFDITERKQAEEALRESEHRLAEAQRIAHVGHWEWNIDTDEILWSDETYRIKGLPPQSIHTLAAMQNLVHPEDRPIRNDALAQALRGETRYDVEYRVIHPEGEVRFVHSQGDVQWDESGRPRRMFGTVQDITDRKRAEEQLSLAFQRIELAQQAALAAFYEFRPKTDEVIRSDAHTAMLGYTLGELKPTKAGWESVIHPDDLAAFRDIVSNAVRERNAYAFEYRVRHKAGHYLWVSDKARVMRDEAGEVERIVGMIRDITPRKQAEEGLREKERLLLDSQRLAHIGSWSMPLNTDRVHWTEETYRIYGVDPDSFVPTTASLLALLHAEDRPAMQDWMQACMAGEHPDALELRAIRPDGSMRILEGRGDLEYTHDGAPVRIVGTVQDITERKQSEEALRESERKLAEAQRVAHVGHWERDLDTGQVLWSDETYRILGLSPQNGFRPLSEFEKQVHPEDRSGQREALAQALQGGPRYDVEYRIVQPNGEVRFVHSQCDVMWDKAGRPRRTFGTIQDITEQKLAEEALRRSTEIQRRAMEIALVSGFVYEVANGNFHLSEEAATLYGLPSLMPIEEAWKYVHPDDLAHAQAAWRAGLAGALYNVEYRSVLHGQTRWINARAKPETDSEGRVVRIIGVLQDITDRRQLEDQLRQAQKMEAVGQLAAGVAHDFNNLMTVIIGYCYMLLRRFQPDDPLRGPVRESYKAAEQAAALTRQLLAFSRQQVLEPKVVSLGTILADTEEMLRVLVGDGVRVEMRSNPSAGLVRVDPAKIQQVLINLAANARDAMPEGGVLSLSTDKVAVTEEYARNRVGLNAGAYSLLTVTDTGKGMDQETVAHLFEPFFTTKEPGRGTGLGMAVVYGIVNQSRGYIDVFSKLGEGTTFKIYFPLVDERGVPEMPELGVLTSATLPEGKETVLLVEDEEAVRTLAGNVLRASGYTVLEAANGLEAVNLAQSHEGAVDLVVADVVMPYLGGRSLVEKLAKLKPGLKVLFISGHVGETVERHGVREADFPFLEKPFTPIALTQKIREVLETLPNPQAR